MINIKILERKWFNYKLKNILIIFIVIVFMLISGVILSIFYFKYGFNITFIKKIQIEVLSWWDNTPKVTLSPKKINKENKINPSISVIEPIIPIIDSEEKIVKKNKTILKKPYTPPEKTNSQTKINIKKNSKNFISKIKKKFKSTQDPQFAIIIAKDYYSRKNYKKSEKWALIANKINRQLDDSWIIFAKSKVKLGNKKEAIRILSAYYKINKSEEILEIITKIKKGKI